MSNRARHNRRDRRKAKSSDWSREGKANPKKVAHANYDGRESSRISGGRRKWKPVPQIREVVKESDGFVPEAFRKLSEDSQ